MDSIEEKSVPNVNNRVKEVSTDHQEFKDLESQPKNFDFNHNIGANIHNPLKDLTREELLRQVDGFAVKHDLEDILPMLQKGALVAQDPENYEDLADLNDEEKAVLKDEIDHKWSHPRALYLTVILCSIGAATQGWDQTGSNAANLSFPTEFGIANEPWIEGVVNGAPYLTAACITSWLSDPINHYLGRRGTIFLAGIFGIISPIGSACTQNWQQLFVCRLLLGVCIGLKEVTAPVFAAENSPPRIRGALVMSWQLWTAFGIFVGFCANLILFNVGNIAWRLQLASAFIPAVPLVILVYFCPESPRWYLKKKKYRDAWNSLKRLRKHELQAARDLYYINALLEAEEIVMGNTGYVKRWIELFTIPRIRRATLASWVVMIGQQMCGINIMSFYSTTIFSNTTTNKITPLWASFGFGLINFTFAWPAVWTIDTFGRRNLLLFTFPNMAWTLLAGGFCFFIPTGEKRLGAVAFFVYLFTAFYSPGEGPVPFTYSAEVFPLSHREVGMAWAVATNNTYAFILTLTFFRILEVFTAVGAFGFYAGLNVLAFVMIFLWMPETKERTLEELDYIFGVPTKVHMHYQITKALPYFVQRYIYWNKSSTLEPLYHFDKIRASADSTDSLDKKE